jgi:hypothetical protein
LHSEVSLGARCNQKSTVRRNFEKKNAKKIQTNSANWIQAKQLESSVWHLPQSKQKAAALEKQCTGAPPARNFLEGRN